MANSLKINVFLIPEEGQHFVFSEGDAWFKGCFKDSEIPDFVLDKVEVDCLITKTAGTIFIKGVLSAQINICCSRCLEKTNLPIGSDFAYTLMPVKNETNRELELTPDDLEISYYQGDFIDLTPVICEQIILQIPIKALCKEDCKGLCQRCGMNLNVSPCNCKPDVVDGRMAALKNFIIKN